MEIFLLIIVILYTIHHIYNYSPLFSKLDKKQYMKSKEWYSLRDRILKRDNHKCCSCGTSNRLEIHHITYKRLGNEHLKDLVTVCRKCHQKIHDKYGYNYSSFFPLIK